MSGIKKILLGLLVILIMIQFIHPARNKSGQGMPNDISKMVAMPGDVRGILKKPVTTAIVTIQIIPGIPTYSPCTGL